ncbi:hypothetical protein CAP39_03565 [Sphingomonas sp. IBVSS1]|nr:hypothetical protein CAP39_03565 [Sphingomonas sp. IBVSS1]
MRIISSLAVATVTALLATGPAAAVNKIINGSFEQAGTTGVGAFTGWNKLNTPDNSPSQDQPASVIRYNSNAAYPISAYGERVTPDNSVSASPDAVGSRAAYFVGDHSVDETLYQDIYLAPGNFRVGFSYYLTANGLRNRNNASLTVSILGIPVTTTMITGTSPGQSWFNVSGVGQIKTGGWYRTALVFNSNGAPAKDVVVDRVFGMRTTDAATVVIGPGIAGVPEPATWATLLTGFALVGLGMRRNKALAA